MDHPTSEELELRKVKQLHMYCDMLVKFWNNIDLQNNIGIGKSLVELPEINIASFLKTSLENNKEAC